MRDRRRSIRRFCRRLPLPATAGRRSSKTIGPGLQRAGLRERQWRELGYIPQGLKPHSFQGNSAARLKSCPFKTAPQFEFVRSLRGAGGAPQIADKAWRELGYIHSRAISGTTKQLAEKRC